MMPSLTVGPRSCSALYGRPQMIRKQSVRSAAGWLACGAGLAAGAYATYASATWLRYGKVRLAVDDEQDSLLDRFMPTDEVVERHHIRVAAPADITFAAMCDVDLQRSRLVRGIFKGRELMLRSKADSLVRPPGLLALTQTLGWGILAEVPGREVVVGAVTQPWKSNVVFRALPPDRFAAFCDPDYVKIVFTLRVDPTGVGESVARTETRVMTTDRVARRKFRRYWSMVSPGVVIIRRVALTLVKAEAERRTREKASAPADRFDLVAAGDLDAQC
jgi:hypothetical protein